MKIIRLCVCIALICNAFVLYAGTPPRVQQFINHKDWSFVENKGQIATPNPEKGKDGYDLHPEIKYYGHQGGVYLYCKPGMLSFVFTKVEKENGDKISEATGQIESGRHSGLDPESPDRLHSGDETITINRPSPAIAIATARADMILVGSNPNAQITATDQQEYYENFYLAYTPEQGITHVHTYKTITYKNIYPHIDMVLESNPASGKITAGDESTSAKATADEGGMEYSFIVHSGGRVSDIQIQWNGLENMQMAANGGISYALALGKMDESQPVCYQDGRTVASSFIPKYNRVGFDVKGYDKRKVLVIDPSLVWATYFGGSGDETGLGIVLDSGGNIIIEGETSSTANISTSGAYQTTCSSTGDLFIAKFSSSGSRIWSTYYGVSTADQEVGIGLDDSANILVDGVALNATGLATSGAYQTKSAGGSDAYVAKFTSTGFRIWSTYFGGNKSEEVYNFAVTPTGGAVISGYTTSTSGIASAGAFQTSYGGGTQDAFLAYFSSSGNLNWSTYFGGNGYDEGRGVTCDLLGNLYWIGNTTSTSGIATAGSYQTSYGGVGDAFIEKFSPTGNRIWGTYYGGGKDELGDVITMAETGYLCVSGYTNSTSGISTSGAFKTSISGTTDAFLAKFSTTGKEIWSTYFGGNNEDYGYTITSDSSGYIYFGGPTTSTAGLVTTAAFQTSLKDNFFAKFTKNGNLLWASYFGGNLSTSVIGISTDKFGDFYLSGFTNCTSGIATAGAFQSTLAGGNDYFLAKFNYNMFDAGISTVIGPNSFQCSASRPLSVWLNNFGKSDLDSVTINYSVNHVIQNPYHWKGKIQQDSSALISIGNFTFFGGNDTVRAWTSLPNGYVDSFKSNDSASAIIKVNPLPSAKTIANQGVCNGATPAIGANSVFGDSYLWVSSPAGYSSTSANPSFTLTSNHIFILTETNTSTGCSKTDSVTISVNPLPSASVISNTAICTGNAISIGANAVSKSTYSWTNSASGFSSTSSNPSVSPTSSTSYTLTQTDSNGCVKSDSTTISVNALPAASVISNNGICTGTSISIGAAAITGSSYSWLSTPSGFSSTSSNPLVSPSSTTSYSLTQTDSNGCKHSNVVKITLYSQPSASFTINNSSQCHATNNFSFTDKSSISSGSISSWSWDFGDGNISTTQSPTHTYAAAGTYTVKLVVTSNNGCKDSISNSVTVYPQPVASFSINNSNQCHSTNNFSFTDKSNISSGSISSWSWDFGDGKTSTSQSPTHTYSAAGTYIVKLIITSNNGCKDSTTNSVAVYPQTSVDFAINDSGQCLTGNSFGFTDHSVVSSGSISTWSWSFGDTKTSTSQSPTHNYTTSGTYRIQLTTTTDHSCTDTLSKSVKVFPQSTPSFSVNQGSQCLSSNSFGFIDKSSISSGSISSWAWNFGDSKTSASQNPDHTYTSAGTYHVKLQITSDNGCVDTVSSFATVYPQPVASFTINNSSQCYSANSFRFTDKSSISSGSISSWAWDFGDGKTSTSQSPTHTYSAAGAYTVKLVITSNNGCKDSTTNPVTVYPQTSVDFAINDSGQCLTGNSFGFTDHSVVSSGSISTWSWSFGDTKTSTSQSPTHNYASSGTYRVQLTTTTDHSCTDTLSQSVKVFPQSTPSFSVNQGSQCLSSNSFGFIDKSSISSGSISSWAWNFGDSKTSASQNPNHTYTSVGTDHVKLQITSDNGCVDTVSSFVTVYPQPVASFSINNSSQCYSANSFSFTDKSSISSGSIASWSWDFGDGNSSTTQSPTHTYAAAGTYTVKLVVTSNNGCKDSTTNSVTVYPQTSVDFAINDSGQCLTGNSFGFTDHSVVSSGSISTWSWSFGDTKTSTSQSPTHNYTTSGTYRVQLTTTTDHSCTDTLSQSVKVFPQSTPSFSVNQGSQCLSSNSFGFIDKSSISSGSISSWAWNFGDSKTSASQSPNHIYTSAGTYHVKLETTSDNGCIDTVSSSVTIYPKPTASFSVNSSGQCSRGNSFVFTDQSTVSTGKITGWKWDFGDADTSDSQNPSHSYTTAGTYKVKLLITTGNGCTDTFSQFVTVYPQASDSFSINKIMQCFSGNGFIFSDKSDIATGTIASWKWDFGDDSTATSQNPAHSYLNPGSYKVILATTSNDGCTDTVSRQVTVHPMPDAYTGSSTAICYGASIVIGKSTVPGNTYLWTTASSGFSSTTSNPTVNPTATTTYYLTETISATGCSKADSVKITVNPLPDAVAGSSGSICLNSFTSIGAAAISGDTYQWSSYPSGYTSTESDPTISPAQATKYYLKETITATGCTKTDSVQIGVNPLPKANSGNNTTICPGTGQVIGADSVEGDSYSWTSYPAGFSSTWSNPPVVPSASKTYILTETIRSTGCEKTDSVHITIDTACRGYLTVEMDSSMNTFDTLRVDVRVHNTRDVYSLYSRLEINPNIFKLVSSQAGNFLGTNVIATPPIENKGYIDFGITKIGSQAGSTGNGLFYSFWLVVQDSFPKQDITSYFSHDSIIAYDHNGNHISLYDSSYKTVNVHSRVLVWPGDLNNDRKVDVADILPIGYFYNVTGPKRSNASLSWAAQQAPFWGYDKSARNKKGWAVFADADGNGIVGLADQAAIGLNLSKSHSKRYEYSKPVIAAADASDPTLTATFADTMILNTSLPKTITIPINIGSASVPVNNLNGLAFNLFFNAAYIDPASVKFDYTGSFFGSQTSDFIKQEDIDVSNGKISLGITRFNDASLSGYGRVANLTFTIPANAPTGYFTLTTSVIQATDSIGNNISVNSSADSMRIALNSGFNLSMGGVNYNLEVFPNPFHASATVRYRLPENSEVKIMLYDMSGKMIGVIVNKSMLAGDYSSEINAEKYHLNPGVYLLKFMVDGSVENRKVVLY